MTPDEQKERATKVFTSLDRSIKMCRKVVFTGLASILFNAGFVPIDSLNLWAHDDVIIRILYGITLATNLACVLWIWRIVRRPLRDLRILRQLRCDFLRSLNSRSHTESELWFDQLEAGFKALDQ